MKQALIDITTPVQWCSGWIWVNDKYQPVITILANSARVCEVVDQSFPVASPLFWMECADEVMPDQWYYNTQDATIIIIPPNPPKPESP